MAVKVIAKSDTHAGLRGQLNDALKAKHASGSQYSEYDSPYISDVTDDKVIHDLPQRDKRGKLFASSYKKGTDGSITLGDPKEVEQAYKPLKEAERVKTMEATRLSEAGAKPFDANTGLLTITIIKEGFNTSKSKYYSRKALKETGGVFAGAKMFANHQTVAEEKARPEGRVQDWVASVVTDAPWLESDGRLRSKAKVHDAAFKQKLTDLQEAGHLGDMGISIRGFGKAIPAEVEGTKTNYVESFGGCKSVDFVTFAGAGGKVDLLESDGQHYLTAEETVSLFEESDSSDIDFVGLEKLKESRPDLVEQITQEVRETIMAEKTVEQLTQELKEANEKNTRLEGENKTLTESGKKAAAATELDKQLKESGLPEASQKKMREQYKDATESTGFKEAITGEVNYLRGLGVEVKQAASKGVHGMGTIMQESNGERSEKDIRKQFIAQQVTMGVKESDAVAIANDRFGYVSID